MNNTEIATLIRLRYGARTWDSDTIDQLPRELIENYFRRHTTRSLETNIEQVSNSELLVDLLYTSHLKYNEMLDDIRTLLYQYEAGIEIK